MRTIVTAILLAFAASGVGYAADDSLDKTVKKTADGFGELLKGMGKEIKKTGITNEAKKEEKKAPEPSEAKGEKERKSP